MAMVEPWLRGTHTELEPVRRAVLHALELAAEDAARWCSSLSADAMERMPLGLSSVACQARHIARSLDRLMTYAEGRMLTDAQMLALHAEGDSAGDARAEFALAIETATRRLLAIDAAAYADARFVGRDRLRTTLGALLIHIAEHTQRHVGQLITTAKVVAALSDAEVS